jgi:hypothetical protein
MFNPALLKKVKLQYFFDRSHYVAGPGETVQVNVALQETFNPGASSSLLASGTDGLSQGGVLIEVSSPLPTSPAVVRASSSIIGNSDFDFAVISLLPEKKATNRAGILGLSASPVFGSIVSRSAACETVLLPLATFTFTVGRIPGEVTFLTAMVPDALAITPGEINVTNSGVVLDELIQPGSAMITVGPKATGQRSAEKLAGLASALGSRVKYTERR